ncbi:nucleotidyltransferase [Rhodoplanes elegans]|uniref:Nucleotidyltransferase n=1 Tax=Rhodoplanes elegans TaxID=29408 RepID=A0A327K579_9BRAD|nr:nucleotidyltransferase domain-containing protein [Rhodoplanes elegans]MBK5959012.1 nucleotidyltransferase [Rhodoplanes elegans]RAI33044.1 nucleotidyltransferase [Rhodoplanes elegans]
MNRQDVLDILRRNRDALRARGVVHAALFGSVARGEEVPGSDIDIVIDLAPDLAMDVYQYVGLTSYIEDLFPAPVDVVDREMIKPIIRDNVVRDSIYAF